MTTEPDDIVRNAKLASYRELICEEDLGNLSLSLDDSKDDSRINFPDGQQPGPSDTGRTSGYATKNAVEDAIKSARSFINSDAFNNITKDKVTVNWEREKTHILCSNPKHHALMCSQDKALAKGRVCSMDLVLMASKDFPLTGVFDNAMKGIVQARRNSTSSHYGTCPAVHVCLAWLCHAAQCPISSVVPGGEIYPNADRYIRVRLEQECLPIVDESERIELAIFQLCRVLDVLSVSDLRSQTSVDRSILIFAICRLLLDRNTCCAIQHRASMAIENILNASALTKHATLVEFSSIFPLISDDLVNLQLCHEIVRLSNVDPTCCLSLFSSTLIHVSERAECVPSDLDKMSTEEFVDAHLGVIIDVLDDTLEIFENDNKYKCVILTMLDSSLHPSLCSVISESRSQQLTNMLQRLKHELGKSPHPDGALVYRLLRNLTDRYEIQSHGHAPMFPMWGT